MLLKVHNEGQPIAQEMIGTIFDPLVRAKNPERNMSGLGLGLFVVKEIVSAHCGTGFCELDARCGDDFFGTPAAPRVVIPISRAYPPRPPHPPQSPLFGASRNSLNWRFFRLSRPPLLLFRGQQDGCQARCFGHAVPVHQFISLKQARCALNQGWVNTAV